MKIRPKSVDEFTVRKTLFAFPLFLDCVKFDSLTPRVSEDRWRPLGSSFKDESRGTCFVDRITGTMDPGQP